jgi:hypothetical protein
VWIVAIAPRTAADPVFATIVCALVGAYVAELAVWLRFYSDDARRGGKASEHLIESVIAAYYGTVGRIHFGQSLQFVVMGLICAAIWTPGLLLLFRAPNVFASLETEHIAAIAGVFATAGWVATSWVTSRNAQRQNTMTLLVTMRHSDMYSRHFNNVYVVAQSDMSLAQRQTWIEQDRSAKWWFEGEWRNPSEAPHAAATVRSAHHSLFYILNYYEFIAAGVRTGALDAAIVNETIRPHMHFCFNHFRAWIEADRDEFKIPKWCEHLQWHMRKFPRPHAGA